MSTQKQIKSLSNLISYYELCNKSESKSQKTVSWYTANLRQFHHYLQARHLSDSVDDIDLQVLREYVLSLLKSTVYPTRPFLACSYLHYWQFSHRQPPTKRRKSISVLHAEFL